MAPRKSQGLAIGQHLVSSLEGAIASSVTASTAAHLTLGE
jgi:hypothetical protein